jgi:hypothetical protein
VLCHRVHRAVAAGCHHDPILQQGPVDGAGEIRPWIQDERFQVGKPSSRLGSECLFVRSGSRVANEQISRHR